MNAVESGANNFAAFQALAMQLNGTNATSSSGSGSGKTSGAEMSARTITGGMGAGALGVLVGVFMSVLF